MVTRSMDFPRSVQRCRAKPIHLTTQLGLRDVRVSVYSRLSRPPPIMGARTGPQRRALGCASFRRRTRQASCDQRDGRRSGRSLVEGSQLRSVIGYEDGEQACRLGRAGVLADEMLAARGLEKAFSCRVHLGRTCPRALRADRS
jgi:hypothetical protein